MAIAVQKLTKEQSYQADGYTETVEYAILHCGNVDGNANKYYVLEVQKNPTDETFRLYSEYGRIGSTPARDLRVNLSEDDARKEFERIKKSKLRKKTKARNLRDGKEKHQEQYHEVDLSAPTVGSPNIRVGADITQVKTTKKTSGSALTLAFRDMGFTPSVQTLLNGLLTENVHNIEESTNITVTRNGLETPLGPVTTPHIDRAREVLNKLQAFPYTGNSRDSTDRTVRDLNNDFFSLIPQHMGRKITEADMLLKDDDIDAKYDLLQGMEAALAVTTDQDDKPTQSLGIEVIECPDTDDVHKFLTKKVHSTMIHNDVKDMKVRRVFEVINHKEHAKYCNPVSDAPEYDLFHGSVNSNLLSIMLKGFYIPPTHASYVTGRMFGNGVYGASESSKSLRYSVGLWGGQRNQIDSVFLFVVRFGMGKIYSTNRSHPSGAPKGYHSIHAKAGLHLRHDEYIVYNTDQVKVTHLIELKR